MSCISLWPRVAAGNRQPKLALVLGGCIRLPVAFIFLSVEKLQGLEVASSTNSLLRKKRLVASFCGWCAAMMCCDRRDLPAMCTPPKRTQWREDLQHLRRDYGFSKKVLLNCCLVRRIISWASPNTKGRTHPPPTPLPDLRSNKAKMCLSSVQ